MNPLFFGLRAAMVLGPVMTPPASNTNYPVILTRLVTREDEAMVAGNRLQLSRVFLSSDATSARVAWRRSLYFRSWAKARGITFRGVAVRIHIDHLKAWEGSAAIKARVGEEFLYSYADDPSQRYRFGLGVHHQYDLQRLASGAWRIANDDCFPPADWRTIQPGVVRGHHPVELSLPRITAQAYADQFCGAAPQCGNGKQYNSTYNDYNDAGGDCTAFVSQVLHAAGFAETAEWRYNPQTKLGTEAWSNAGSFTRYLSMSGRASLLAKGDFEQMLMPSQKYPQGPLDALQVGDLITNFRHGRMQHSGIVVGFDAHGYPLVDAHSSDRYHVPFDINWDAKTTYYLWKVHYRLAAQAPKAPSPGDHTAWAFRSRRVSRTPLG
jgi:hypothetical protein